jgi:hypothetical protein
MKRIEMRPGKDEYFKILKASLSSKEYFAKFG